MPGKNLESWCHSQIILSRCTKGQTKYKVASSVTRKEPHFIQSTLSMICFFSAVIPAVREVLVCAVRDKANEIGEVSHNPQKLYLCTVCLASYASASPKSKWIIWWQELRLEIFSYPHEVPCTQRKLNVTQLIGQDLCPVLIDEPPKPATFSRSRQCLFLYHYYF